MLTNFLNVWILSRVTQAAVSALLCLLGVGLGLRIALRWQPGQSSARQLGLERQAELVASIVQVALIFEILGLVLSVLVTDHLVGGIRGAMCAFGVLASTKSGFPGLLTTLLAAAACAEWMILHRLDLQTERPVLTRRKFLWLIPVGILVVADLVEVIAFVGQLDFQVIASCCSVWLDDALVNNQASRWIISPLSSGLIGLAVTLAALAFNVLVWRRPRRDLAWVAGGLSALAPVTALPAVLGVVAPHVLGTPTHFCPFCLLHAQGHFIGWPLFAALFLGSATGMGLGVVELNRNALTDPAPVVALERALARWSVVGWAGALLSGVTPVVLYWIHSGGVSVFG